MNHDYLLIRELISNKLEHTYDKLEIFKHVCERLNYEVPDLDEVQRWFKDIGFFHNPNIPQKQLNLMMAIDEKHWDVAQQLILDKFRSKHNRVSIFSDLNCQLNNELIELDRICEFLRSASAYTWNLPIPASISTHTYIGPIGMSRQKLLKCIDETFWRNFVGPILKQEVNMERSMETIFSIMCSKIGFDSISDEMASLYFQASRFQRYDLINDHFNADYLKLADNIVPIYLKYKYSIGFSPKNLPFHVMPSNSRYACYLNANIREGLQLYLADLFHGVTR